MAIASTTALLIASGLAATSALSQGYAANQQSRFEANVSQQQATREREIAASEEQDFRRRQSAVLAERRAALGGSGIQTTTGSPLLSSEDFAAEVELQARRIRAGGQIRATRLEQQASLLRARGRTARTQGLFRAGSSLLSGFSEFNDRPRPRPTIESIIV